MLVQAGVRSVLAPLWKVDDFSSLLFLTHFSEAVKAGNDPVSATHETANWLRNLGSQEAAKLAGELVIQAGELARIRNGAESIDYIPELLIQIRDQLQMLDKDVRPFRSPLDWAAFQLVGLPGI